MGYSKGGVSAGSHGNPVRNELHQKKIGYGGTEGGAADNIKGMRNVDGI